LCSNREGIGRDSEDRESEGRRQEDHTAWHKNVRIALHDIIRLATG